MRIFLLIVLTGLLLNACSYLPREQAQQQAPPQTNAQPPPVTSPAAAEALQYAKSFSGSLGFYARNLQTGQELGWQADSIFPTASTHKLVVALAIYKYLYAAAASAEKQRYDTLIARMMEVSDNPAFFELLKVIEGRNPTALTQVLSDLQLSQTRIHSEEAYRQYGYHSVTTPKEMALVLSTIYHSAYLPADSSAILKEELANTIFKEEIPRYLQDSKVMHKVGQLPDSVLNDVGIIDDGRSQILISLFSKTTQSPEYASNYLATLSAKLYQGLHK